MDKLLTVSQVSELLQIGKTNTYKLFRKKDFPMVRIGNKCFVKETELDKYLSKYTNGIIRL